MINETLYKSRSTEAHQLMRDDPKVFEEVCLMFWFLIYHLKGESIT